MNTPNISLEFTPNPNTLKYVLEETILEKGPANFATRESATKSPLATRLFEVLGVAGVMIGRNFVTITKGSDGDWESLNRGVMDVMKDHLGKGLPVVDADYVAAHDAAASASAGGGIEDKIREILDREIRPAVAMDGGDITFDRFEAGVVYLQMQGSCSGCPSSTATLKQGIETRLKSAIPEIQEVVSV
ncbi:MAG TPA: NifU family protein [Oligoflexia bacterium]|nr:NifU family protein [Oligoflexia bacterium]